MRLLEGSFASWPAPRRGAAVTVGVYDGVHVGHQRVIMGLHDEARARQLETTVVTFRQHPAVVLAPDRVPPQLTTLEQRLDRFAALGVDQVALLDFDDELRNQSPEAFVQHVLVEGLGTRFISVGEGFRFGHRQAGDIAVLAELGSRYGFDVAPVSLIGGSEPFSATRIREALAAGDVATVNQQLGRRFEVCGTVVRGDGRGHAIGVPTANLALESHQALPARGVYAVIAGYHGNEQAGVANIGTRPTFGGTHMVLEVHILDAAPDLYGQKVCVAFVARIRQEEQFSGVDALVAQITADIAMACELL